MRVPMVAGNWKMHKLRSEATDFLAELLPQIETVQGIEIVLCPPFTALESVAHRIQNSSVKLGAQNVFWAEQGAFTGEVSPSMLRDIGCQYVICGHSERRQLFGETDTMVSQRIQAALAGQLVPIFCFGETLEQRQAGQTLAVCRNQLVGGLKNLTPPQVAALVFAYEPVWAIGTGHTATPQDAAKIIEDLRQWMAQIYSSEVREKLRILYGGSVNPDNIQGIIAQPSIDGVLVGGASLQARAFAQIIAGYVPL